MPPMMFNLTLWWAQNQRLPNMRSPQRGPFAPHPPPLGVWKLLENIRKYIR